MSKFVGTGPSSYEKKNLPVRGLTKVEKHYPRLYVWQIRILKTVFLKLTYCMKQSPAWQANRFAGSQKIPRILLNPKVHYRIHRCRPDQSNPCPHIPLPEDLS